MKHDMPRVALVMVAVADLSGSGGAERQFSDLFRHLRAVGPLAVTFITSRVSIGRLRAAGRLQGGDGIVALPLGNRPAQTKAGIIWMTLVLAWATLGRGFDVVHICLPTPSYVPYAALVTRLPRAWRPRVTLTVLDCTLAHHLTTGGASDLYEQQVLRAHQMYFRWTRLDGIYTWYRAFVDAAQSLRLLPARAVLAAARYCFTDPARFTPQPAKSRTVVYAGRLSVQKRPLLFVDAVAALLRRHPDLARGWSFEMYGGGVLEPDVRARIAELHLDRTITLTSAPDLAPVFSRSQVFVSTQAFENFTSLAILEAMAAGNVIVAEDAGQTSEFVRDGENGILIHQPTPDAFADAVARVMQFPERFAEMGAESRRLATEVHTIEHFAADIVSFWSDVAAGRANT
jgi:glycosyltransferase involved in cell wall biosynthesis